MKDEPSAASDARSISPKFQWQLKTRSLRVPVQSAVADADSLPVVTLPAIMGIVNVTPDSFSDGGSFHQASAAIDHAMQLVSDGANILDIGGESTRPYSEPVGVQQELERVIPVIEGLITRTNLPISIDTSKAAVAKAALNAGAEIINDVTGLDGDPQMIEVAIETGAGLCVMHMQGNPQTMQDDPTYENVVEDIFRYLIQRRDHLVKNGIDRSKICLDPGIGFGKTHEDNLELLRSVARFHDCECPILVGHSRKGFIRKFTDDSTDRRVAGTLAVSLHLARVGIQIIRVHDVLETRQGLLMQAKIGTE